MCWKDSSALADIVLSVDANSAYTLDEVEHLRKFDAFNLLMIEQPLWNDEIYLHARCRNRCRRDCLDESILNARDADFALEIGLRIINIKVGAWAVQRGKKIHDVTVRHNLPVWCGGCWNRSGTRPISHCRRSKIFACRRCIGIEALLEGRHHRAEVEVRADG